jgi:Tetratricopeptide repeat
MQPPEDLTMGVSEMNGVTRSQKEWAVAGRVMNMAGDVIEGATVQISPMQAGEYRMFKSDASGDFETLYFVNEGYVTDFKVWLTVKKRGFQTAHELIDYAEFPTPVRLPITLRPDEQSSNLLSQQELFSDLLPQLKSLAPSDAISAKSEKAYTKGVHEFTDKGRPDRSLDYFSNVVKHEPACAKCRTMLALAELDSGNWDGAARSANSAAQMTLKNKAGGSPQALVLGGVMESWLHRPQEATNFLVRADKLAPKDPLVLQEIGRAQLQLQKYEMADAYLQRAIAAGAGPDSRLLRVQALLGEDDLDGGNAEMKRYLNGRNPKTMPIEVRRVWAMVQNRKEIRTLYVGANKAKRRRGAAASIDYLQDSARQLKGLVPAKNQDSLKPILTAVGKNIAALFRGFQNSTSVEAIHQERLGHNGKVSGSIDGKFRYLCLMPSDPGIPGFSEYRQNLDPDEGLPGGLEQGYMLTSGFASAALIFYPAYQSGSQFRYLGRETVDGRETYVIAFAQIPMKAELVGNFRSGNNSAPTFEQGLAWIDTQNDQIIRLRTDLLRPLPQVRLKEETTQIDYHEVYFKKLAQSFWLPKDVTVTVDWRGKKLRNEHEYSDFKLFQVADSEKIKNPKAPKMPAKDAADARSSRQ